MNIDEKINLYRYHLLSRNRVVTPEDIKALCRSVMGKELREVAISKGVSVQPGVSEGYSRTVDIKITLSKPKEHYAAGSLEYLKDELLTQLKENSANNYPYRISFF